MSKEKYALEALVKVSEAYRDAVDGFALDAVEHPGKADRANLWAVTSNLETCLYEAKQVLEGDDADLSCPSCKGKKIRTYVAEPDYAYCLSCGIRFDK
jgi:hypothetical protein